MTHSGSRRSRSLEDAGARLSRVRAGAPRALATRAPYDVRGDPCGEPVPPAPAGDEAHRVPRPAEPLDRAGVAARARPLRRVPRLLLRAGHRRGLDRRVLRVRTSKSAQRTSRSSRRCRRGRAAGRFRRPAARRDRGADRGVPGVRPRASRRRCCDDGTGASSGWTESVIARTSPPCRRCEEGSRHRGLEKHLPARFGADDVARPRAFARHRLDDGGDDLIDRRRPLGGGADDLPRARRQVAVEPRPRPDR
jgi:hypothetical protein